MQEVLGRLSPTGVASLQETSDYLKHTMPAVYGHLSISTAYSWKDRIIQLREDQQKQKVVLVVGCLHSGLYQSEGKLWLGNAKEAPLLVGVEGAAVQAQFVAVQSAVQAQDQDRKDEEEEDVGQEEEEEEDEPLETGEIEEKSDDEETAAVAEPRSDETFFSDLGENIRRSGRERKPPQYHDDYIL